MDKDTIKRLIIEYQQFVANITLIEREIHLSHQLNYVFVGLRRAGKSYLMYQQIQSLLNDGHQPEEILYFNFEDDRLVNLTVEDLDLIKVSYEELYPHKPIFFLDEIQIVEHWEKFARRLADQQYRVYITGSNAKMLSAEIATTLGGRYIVQNVYPFSFSEFLKASKIEIGPTWYYKNRTEIVRTFSDYFSYGGLPELMLIETIEKRQWLSNLFNKIFFGDLITRYSIRNDLAMKVLIRKLAESVKQPSSFNRLTNIVSTTGAKVSTDTIIDYLNFLQATWLFFSLENYASKLVEKISLNLTFFSGTESSLFFGRLITVIPIVRINTSLIEFLKLFKKAITLVSSLLLELNKIGAFNFWANGLIASASAKSSPLAMNTLSLFIELATFTDPSYLFLPLILLTFLPVTD